MTPRPRPLPWSVFVGLTVAVLLDTFVQVTWKQSVSGISDRSGLASVIATALRTPLFYVAMAGFAAQLLNWTQVLAKADLSFAQPITALSYISVLAISRGFLHETLSVGKIAGVVLILAGVACISQSGEKPGEAPPKVPYDA